MSGAIRPIGGKVVAITGAARGIGRATAIALTRRGARVAIGDIDVTLARETAQEIGGGTIALPLNVTDRESVHAFLDATEEQLGPIDVLVNNAGIMPISRFLDESPESIERQFSINVMGVINGMQLVLPRMLKRGSGHVINVSSTAGKFAAAGLSTYCGTKHAVVGITDSVRIEMKDTPIVFSMVMPVIVRTELTSGVKDMRGVRSLQPEDVADSIVEAVETGRYEVWCPRVMLPLYKTTKLLPTRLVDTFNRALKADAAMLEAADSPARLAYTRRIEAAGPDRQLVSGSDDD